MESDDSVGSRRSPQELEGAADGSVDGRPGSVGRPGHACVKGKGAWGTRDHGSRDDQERLCDETQWTDVDDLWCLVDEQDTVEVCSERRDPRGVEGAACLVDPSPLLVHQRDRVDAYPRKVEAEGSSECNDSSRRTAVSTTMWTEGQQDPRQLDRRS